ncbi:MAG: MFS transporter [Thermoleophilia bacterium]|nr:MFS transporter [Thermoleophilia bacterium]
MTRRRTPLVALFGADAVSLVGNAMALVAIPWFVLQETGRPALAGLVGFFTFLPPIVAGLLGGALVDRLGFRSASVLSDVASGAAVVAIPLLHVTVGLQLPVLYALVFLGALLDAPGATARRSLLPDVAELAGMRIERATGIREAIQRGSLLVGAPLAGVLIASLGAVNVLWLNAGSFLVSAALVGAAVPAALRHQADDGAGRYLAQLASGIRFVYHDRLVRAVLLTVLLTNFLDAPLTPVLMPVFASEAFGSAVSLGVVLGTFGGFALLSSLVFGVVGHRLPRRRTFVLAFMAASLPYVALSTLPSLPVTLVIAAWWGVAAGPLNPVLGVVAYERVPPHMRGRVFGVGMAGSYAAIPLGALLGGVVVEAVGIQTTLLGIGLCYLAVTGFGLVNPAFREMDALRAGGAPQQSG